MKVSQVSGKGGRNAKIVRVLFLLFARAECNYNDEPFTAKEIFKLPKGRVRSNLA
jgi:hypothetical protein